MLRLRRAGLREVLWRRGQVEVTASAAAVAAVKAPHPVVAAAVVALRRHRLDPCCQRTAASRQR